MSGSATTPPLRFAEFTLDRAQRRLRRGTADVPLIPRYLDLLTLLVLRRDEAVHRTAIRDSVWSDVVVSDSAISQAIRTLRRTLGDDPREPRFIRTVSRHGYQFVCPVLSDGADALSAAAGAQECHPATSPGLGNGSIESEMDRLLSAAEQGDDDEALDAAEALHLLGTADVLQRLDRRPGHERARAFLRDARWDVRQAGRVPLLGRPGAARSVAHLVRLRLRRLLRPAEARWASAALGGGAAGLLAGLLGGTALVLGPGSRATGVVPLVLGLLGAIVGAAGATGVGAGLAAAEAISRSARGLALVVGGAIGGAAVGAATHLLASATLTSLFGRSFSPLGGGFEGFVIGGAAGLGYALTTEHADGLAAPRRWRRLLTATVTGVVCAAFAALLALSGRHLGAMSVDVLGRSFPGSQVTLDPLARWLGEDALGPLTRLVISVGEGLFFGWGLAFGLTRRPRQRPSNA
jgi:DNA-binding winged helix-turn-helix (wHTH) protein